MTVPMMTALIVTALIVTAPMMHHTEFNAYYVPADPMDEMHCDSYQ